MTRTFICPIWSRSIRLRAGRERSGAALRLPEGPGTHRLNCTVLCRTAIAFPEMAEYTKSERARLRALASQAYERELGHHLAELERSFSAWRRGEIASSDLSQEIHEFHQGAARDVWSSYQLPRESTIVARAIALGILERQEIPTTLLSKLESEIRMFQKSCRST